MKELLKRTDSINHLKHFGKKDPNQIIYDAYLESGDISRATKFLQYRKEWEMVGKTGAVPAFPYFVTLGLNNSCNLSCAHCYRTFNKDVFVKNSLKLNEVAGLINECKKSGVYSMALGSESEAFTYKHITDVIRLISEGDFVDTWICTNGTLLNDHYIELILKSNVTRLTISIDAMTNETYTKVRGQDFYRLMANIFNFLDKRKKLKKKLPILRVTFVKYNLTELESGAFVDYWSRIADEVDVQPLIDVKNVDELRHTSIEKVSCIYPNRMMYINWNGDYKPCCAEFCKHLTIENIKNVGIIDAWHSDYMQDLRAQLGGKKSLNRACLNCLKSLHSDESYKPIISF
jgi:MoaA/NifB/PqqE/SkfB family radical SAM enzyme